MKKSQWNLPNILTALRVVSVPFFIYFLISPEPLYRIIAFVLFALASITDLVDGYLARKWQQETELGKFLDPLADKALVLGAFITFLFLSDQVQIWMVLCIIGRDMLITALRYLAIHRGRSLRTSMFGKIKTTFQMFSISIILASFLIVSYRERGAINAMYREATEQGIPPLYVAQSNLQEFLAGNVDSVLYGLSSFIPYYLMLFTTILTIISGLRYLVTNFRLFLPDRKKKRA
ncbi:MAG: CDP-diacylglycerol--glycerol-3-phosphate 3-phosphatidyltransferase [Leptospiraceae bacterium]|nr:CDP-diacylglycerol--glycerol-3-phosphate 3-phosphatidyltransferase [Leptospiraceae bacterium]